MKQKTYHDRSAKEHPPIQQGSTVRMYKDSSWQIKARVIGCKQHPRSYKIQTEEGKIPQQNRRDLLQTNEPFVAIQPEIESPQQPTAIHFQCSFSGLGGLHPLVFSLESLASVLG